MDQSPVHELNFSDPPSLHLAFERFQSRSQEDEQQLKDVISEEDEPVVTRRELWSYYLYSNSTNGIGPSRYSLTLFQSLATAAGFDPKGGTGRRCNTAGSSGRCVISFGGGNRVRSVNSVVLIANAISFAIMTFLYTFFGGSADHGQFDQWILLFLTGTWWISQLGLVAVADPLQWRTAMALYVVGFTAYGAALVFFAAAFPRLSRNTPEALKAREELQRREITEEEYNQKLSRQKNRISLISSVHYNIGSLFTLLLSLAVILPRSNRLLVTNWTILVATIYSIGAGLWWFASQQKRPGLPLPKRTNYATVGLWSLYQAIKHCRQLPQTFVYLLASVLLADGVNTTTTLIYLIQGESATFDATLLTYLNISQAGASVLSVTAWWYIQNRFSLKTKQMFTVATISTVIIPFWGTLGMFTNAIGFHKSWEFWIYNFIVAVFQTPYYAYAVTMMAELTPPGYENMFFGLYGFSNRASSLIGPSVIQAIINKSGSNWSGFPFLFLSTFLAVLIILCKVDVESGRESAKLWSQRKKRMQV